MKRNASSLFARVDWHAAASEIVPTCQDTTSSDYGWATFSAFVLICFDEGVQVLESALLLLCTIMPKIAGCNHEIHPSLSSSIEAVRCSRKDGKLLLSSKRVFSTGDHLAPSNMSVSCSHRYHLHPTISWYFRGTPGEIQSQTSYPRWLPSSRTYRRRPRVVHEYFN